MERTFHPIPTSKLPKKEGLRSKNEFNPPLPNEANSKNDPVTPFSDEELEYYRGLLIANLGGARTELATLKRQKSEIRGSYRNNPVGDQADLADDASTADPAKLDEMIEKKEKFIKSTIAAIKRVDDKTYGLDFKTLKPIPKERLEKVPHTRWSVDTKE